MNITLNIEAGNPGELHEAITGLAGILVGTVASQPEPEKTKKSSKVTTKQEKQPDPAPVAESNVTTEDTVEDAPDTKTEEVAEDTPDDVMPETEAEEIPTVVELRAAAQTKGGTPEGKKAIKALLDKFGSKSISDVPEDQRAAFLAELNAL